MLPNQSDVEYLMPILEEYASKCEIILELGCGHGNGSTRAFAAGLRRSCNLSAHLVSVDIDPSRPDELPNCPIYTRVVGDSADTKVMLMVSHLVSRKPDLIYVDTDHTYEQMKSELEVWWPMSYQSTTWLFHDTWMFGEYNHMTDAIKEFAARDGWVYTDITKESHGLGRMARG